MLWLPLCLLATRLQSQPAMASSMGAHRRTMKERLGAVDAVSELVEIDDFPPRIGYMPLRCRGPPPGSAAGQRPTEPERPNSVPAGGQWRARPGTSDGGPHVHGTPWKALAGAKLERWREAGEVRWPPKQGPARGPTQEVVPFRRVGESDQPNYTGQLWTRALRANGLAIQTLEFSQTGNSVKQLQEEWLDRPKPSPPPCPARGEYVTAAPYNGATVTGRLAVKRPHDVSKWVEKPVAHGKYALDHMDGTRYMWNGPPRMTPLPASARDCGPRSLNESPFTCRPSWRLT